MKKPSRDPSLLVPGSNEAIIARLEEMERKIERLRSLYETFFSGVERQPPNAARRELNRLMLETQQLQIRNAALRFRFQSLSQKWTLMTTYWNRTMREIESGTYRKDLAKVSRRLAQKGTPLSEQEAVALGIPAGRARALVARQAALQRPVAGAAATEGMASASATASAGETPPAAAPGLPARPPALAPPAPVPVSAAAAPGAARVAGRPPPLPPGVARAPSGVPGISDQDLAALHRQYDQAARHTDRPAPSLERLKEQLAKRLPALREQLGTDRVTFEVVVKDGRVVLRPKPQT